MKSERLLNLMEGADEKFILEAMPDFESTSEGSEKKNESRRGKILIIVSAAASFLIIASSSLYTGFQANNNSNRSPEAENPALVLTGTADETVRKMETTVFSGESHDAVTSVSGDKTSVKESSDETVRKMETTVFSGESHDAVTSVNAEKTPVTETVREVSESTFTGTDKPEIIYTETVIQTPAETKSDTYITEMLISSVRTESELTQRPDWPAPEPMIPQDSFVENFVTTGVNTAVPDSVEKTECSVTDGSSKPENECSGIYEYAVYQGKLYRKSGYWILGAQSLMKKDTADFKTDSYNTVSVKKDVLVHTEKYSGEIFIYLKCENLEGFHEYTEMNGGNDYEN